MQLTLTGTMPLIMHNVQSADPQNAYAKLMAPLKAKRKKTDEDEFEICRLSFLSGLYTDDDGPYLPAQNIFRCLIEAGTASRDGKRVSLGVAFMSDRARLEYPGPRILDELWGDGTGQFVDRRIAVINRARVPITRPIFPKWSATFPMELDPSVLDVDDFAPILTRAGKIGVGDYRRFYGKFTAELT